MVDHAVPDSLLPPMAWNAWGDPALAKPLSAGIRALLEQAMGLSGVPNTPPGLDEIRVEPRALADERVAPAGCVAPRRRDRSADRSRRSSLSPTTTKSTLRCRR